MTNCSANASNACSLWRPNALTREPSYLSIPATAVTSRGQELIDFAQLIDFPLDATQRALLHVLGAEGCDGFYAALELCVVCGRQNLKTYLLELLALADVYLYRTPLHVWTAHRVKTANEAFLDFKAAIARSPWLTARTRHIREGAGEKGIELYAEGDEAQGPRLIILARSRGGGRGLTGDVVTLDEAFALSAETMGDLLPTLSARPNPQVRYGSSAGLKVSAFLRSLRDRGRPGGDPSLIYVEYCAGNEGACGDPECAHTFGAPGCVLDDRAGWLRANPAHPERITRRFLEAERRTLPWQEFARERLGWWDDPDETSDDDTDDTLAQWDACADGDAAPIGPVCLLIDVSLDGRGCAIVACGRAADDTPVVEVVEYRRGRGAAWVPERVEQLERAHDVRAVGLFAGTPAAASLASRLEGVELLTSAQCAAACMAFARAVDEQRLRHRGQGSLAVAVANARRATVGDGWRWSRRASSADISPLMGAAGALLLAERELDVSYSLDDSIY